MKWFHSKVKKNRDARFIGFTLIELLVVISIIALLIAILLPALTKARAAGKAMQCLSNVRQISVSTIAYVSDFDDWLPLQSNTMNFWGGGFQILPTDDNFQSELSPYMTGTFKDNKPAGVFWCTEVPADSAYPGIAWNYRWMGAYDPSVIGLPPPFTLQPIYVRKQLRELTKAAILSGDTSDNPISASQHVLYSPEPYGGGTFPDDIADRHSGAMNSAWSDGHGSSHLSDEVWNNPLWYTGGYE